MFRMSRSFSEHWEYLEHLEFLEYIELLVNQIKSNIFRDVHNYIITSYSSATSKSTTILTQQQ